MIEALLNAEAYKHIAMDKLVDKHREAMIARVKELVADETQRNPAIWQDAVDISADALNLTQLPERGISWLSEYSLMVAHAWRQAWVEIIAADLLNQAQDFGEYIEEIAKRMSPEELKTAAKQGVGEKRRQAIRDAKDN